MNSYPSWIQRIPEMIEALVLLDREWIDRGLVERIFDLRKTAAFHLLRRMGAQRCGNSWGISRDRLMARLREAQENRDWRWESERRQSVRRRIESVETQRRKSLVPVDAALENQMEELRTAGLPEYDPDHGRTAHHPLPLHGTSSTQLVLLAKVTSPASDRDPFRFPLARCTKLEEEPVNVSRKSRCSQVGGLCSQAPTPMVLQQLIP
jgi:hypothetical protein